MVAVLVQVPQVREHNAAQDAAVKCERRYNYKENMMSKYSKTQDTAMSRPQNVIMVVNAMQAENMDRDI